ncbi:cytochrome c-type biogenesis protein CcmH [Alkalimonas delamerensis]|uniref:Cytochrome c-type biogenesis protein n=1 Tax=Alkalimonas delamerensis TaxID=265981 RepID=A0ABT9GMQ7_9GAMM|nr:cytochrome c-type biogenesis protein [Alkalimonas delamerensis]MDP4528263.1 cytochrome c-type biogenesis protein CcmH [Alkalimonas delamerensis]
MSRLLLVAWVLFSTSLLAGDEILPFEDDAKRSLYQELVQQLRCPQCQNQNIAESNAVVSIDMRNKTYELVQQGYSRREVIDFMVDRYGDFVHYSPPLNPVTIWLWILPVVWLVLMAWYMLRRRQSAQTARASNPELEQELDAIIDAYRSKKS